jgi:hypothetical protein
VIGLIEAALAYAGRGRAVLPLAAGGKLPLTKHGLHDATTDAEQITAWWREWPMANVGLALRSDEVVLDSDARHGGEDTLRDLLAELDVELPATRTACTGGGGFHRWFARPPGLEIRNGADRLGRGLDVKTVGGYLVVPPSVTDGPYIWLSAANSIAEAPGWLLERLTAARPPARVRRRHHAPLPEERASAYALKALAEETERVASAPEGARNSTLNAAAFSLGQLVAGGELDEQLVRRDLIDAAASAGLDERETLRTLQSGLAAGSAEPRRAPEPPSTERSSASRTSGLSGAEPTDGQWEQPVPLAQQLPPPDFPLQSLPKWLREWVLEVSAEKGASVDIAANLALAVVCGSLARDVQVQPRPGWYEPTNAYFVTALIPGQRKTPVFKAALRPVRTVERERITEHSQTAHATSLALKLFEKQESELLKAAGTDSDPADMLEQLGERPEVGPPPRLLTEDVTPEGLARLLGDSGRIIVASDEGSALFENLAGKYSRGSSSWDIFNKAHVGTDLVVDRKGSTPVVVFEPALTIGIATQPSLLKALAGKPCAGERGVLARLLYSLPHPVYTDGPTPHARESVVAEYARRITNLYSDVPDLSTDEHDHPRPATLGFSPEARAVFEEWERSLNADRRFLGDEDDTGVYLGWLSKLAGHTARIAAALHAAECWSTGRGASQMTIGADTVRAAVRVAEYYKAHARLAFGLMEELPQQRLATAILKWLSERPAEEFDRMTVRDVHRSRGKGTTAAQVRSALMLLQEHGYVLLKRPEAPPRGGRRTERILAHPSLQPDRSARRASEQASVGSVGSTPADDAGDEHGRQPTPNHAATPTEFARRLQELGGWDE